MSVVYKLFDKRSPGVVRYIGVTNTPEIRLMQHLRCDGSNPTKDAWIQEASGEIGMEIIETGETTDQALLREAYWIHYYLERGEPLTNIHIPSLDERQEVMEKRFDVRVPFANTTLLEELAKDNRKTGIPEARLLVQFATRYTEIVTGVIPLHIAPGDIQ